MPLATDGEHKIFTYWQAASLLEASSATTPTTPAEDSSHKFSITITWVVFLVEIPLNFKKPNFPARCQSPPGRYLPNWLTVVMASASV